MAVKTVTRTEIDAIPKVEFTRTWRPQHHSTVIAIVDDQLQRLGLQPISESFQVSEDGKDLFAVIGVQKQTPSNRALTRIDQIGFRNSMKKNFSLGFVAGAHVMVCSNMSFYGDFVDFMRHDSRMDLYALSEFAGNAIDTIQDRHGVYHAWFDRLGCHPINDNEFKARTFDLLDNGIINPKNFRRFTQDFKEEILDQRDFQYEKTLAHLHGAVTRNLRDQSTTQQMSRTRLLNSYLEVTEPVEVLDDCTI